MPQKLNKAGNVQNYVPAGNGDVSGEYGDNVDGSNRHFTAFKKPEDEGKKKEFKQPDKKRTLYFVKLPSYKYYGIEDGYSLIDKKRYERFKDSANRAKNKYTYETKDVEWNDQEIKDDLKKVMERLINEDNYKEYANYYKEKEIYNELVKMGYDKDLIRSLKQILGGTLWDEENRIYREMRKEFEDNIFKREYKEKVEKGKQALDKLPKIPKEENTVENNLLNTNYQNYQKSIDVYLKAKKEFRSMTSDEYKEFQKYTSNCQSCAQTFILRQKGYNVKAKLSGNTSEDYKLREKGWDLAMFIPKTDKGFEIHSANYYTSTREINTFADNYIKYYKSNSDLANYSIGGQVKSIIDIALRDGDDSTYLLQVGWKGYDMGGKPENDSVSGAHVMVVKNENGKVMLYDPQNNTKEYLNNPEYTIGYADVNNGVFKRVNLNYTNLIRVDDLEINDNIDLIAEAM